MAMYSIFPWGMEMNYFRTGNTVMRDGVFAVTDHNSGLYPYIGGIRLVPGSRDFLHQ